ncbi:hypothetical protein [Haliscomenobacter sp.]|uniref:hypothetical protein n=1 Tax=Haliscomenobacter sp. TaxID=2717303 RepID=UPI003364C3E3
MNTIPIEVDISTNRAECALGARVFVNGVKIYDNAHVTETHHFSHDISDEDGEHELCIELYGKLPEHTQINDAGEITQDALLSVANIQVDGIDISQISANLIEYHHDFNGGQAAIVDRFYGNMGCNGQLKLQFTTPIYLWLLENM